MSDLEVLNSDLEHVGKFIDGFESIVEKFKAANVIDIGGCERYTIGVLSAEGIRFNNTMGGENFVVNAAKKLYEMIASMLKSIKEFFFGRPRIDITVKPVVSEASKRLQELNEKIDKFNKDGVMKLGPLTDDQIYKIIAAPERAIKENEDKAKRIKLNNVGDMKAYRIAKVSAAVGRMVNAKEGLAARVEGMDIAKTVSSHMDYVKLPANNLESENNKLAKSVTSAFNSAAKSFGSKMTELGKYIEEHKDSLPSEAIKSIPMDAAKRIKNAEDLDAALSIVQQLEVDVAASKLKKGISELESLQADLKKVQNTSDETIDETKHLARAIKLLSEALAPMDKFTNFCFDVSIKYDINYSSRKLELIINCINAEHKK